LMVVVVVGGSYWLWQRPLRGLTAAEGSFARLMRIACWLGLRPRTGDTPYEYGGRVATALPEGSTEIATITEAYVAERFGRGRSAIPASNLAAAWRQLRRRLARAVPRLGAARVAQGRGSGSGAGRRWR
jgi:hypothetical protein